MVSILRACGSAYDEEEVRRFPLSSRLVFDCVLKCCLFYFLGDSDVLLIAAHFYLGDVTHLLLRICAMLGLLKNICPISFTMYVRVNIFLPQKRFE